MASTEANTNFGFSLTVCSCILGFGFCVNGNLDVNVASFLKHLKNYSVNFNFMLTLQACSW